MYQALYSKYRPTDFNDVISQPHVTTTLINQIKSGKTGHAYLFTGSRGTGKTTCARILAKALNCESPVDGNPCNRCQNCIDADNFSLSDIIEIDAASNNSVSDARELREEAEYSPERCRYRVYIIDEVHMLSKEAFNALLKIIEEPPPHVKFIMATTELHKVPATILSRCQRFDFVRIRTEDIAARITHVAKLENISIDPDAAALIAKNADGGMRDALSILDRCIAFSESVTADVVSEAAGLSGRDSLFEIAEAVVDKDPSKALGVVAELYNRSKDLPSLCTELTNQFRNLMIMLSAPNKTDILSCLPTELETLGRIAAKTDLNSVMKCIGILSDCSERMTHSLSKRVDMEMCIIKMCGDLKNSASADSTLSIRDSERLNERITSLENAVRRGLTVKNDTAAPPVPQSPPQPHTVSDGNFEYIRGWPQIIERIQESCPSLAPGLFGSDGYFSGGRVIVNSSRPMIKMLLGKDENKARVLEAICTVTGRSCQTVLVGYRPNLDRSGNADNGDTGGSSPAHNLETLLQKAADGGVEIVDN